ncbi:hypothetical protein Nepgr_020070 [Nepenthes gracilis]|uniref:Peroxidase n=1 Tax=Nepenthes gracilis TaxID=150966 RepID=A0AAD3SWZ3_NEPGR|nr:hypothetical protein Nepgr_020070 [Nepenthes gracilis]
MAFANAPSSFSETCKDDSGQLQVDSYSESCPEAEAIIFSWVAKAVFDDPRMAASLLRLHFHDCFGCDGSVLLDDTPEFVGEKTAAPNLNSLRGFEVIDAMKADLESACPLTVSCADVLAIAARDSVVLSNGPGWQVETGRMDGLSASKAAANSNIPAPNSTVANLVQQFQNVGLSLTDMVALSGAHTLGKARCSSFSSRLTSSDGALNSPDMNIDLMQSLQRLCSESGGDSTNTLAELDLVTPATFDNQYYINLLSGEGLLASDQVLVAGDSPLVREIVELYVQDEAAFFDDFRRSMLKMGRLGVLIGSDGEVRRNCHAINSIN